MVCMCFRCRPDNLCLWSSEEAERADSIRQHRESRKAERRAGHPLLGLRVYRAAAAASAAAIRLLALVAALREERIY